VLAIVTFLICPPSRALVAFWSLGCPTAPTNSLTPPAWLHPLPPSYRLSSAKIWLILATGKTVFSQVTSDNAPTGQPRRGYHTAVELDLLPAGLSAKPSAALPGIPRLVRKSTCYLGDRVHFSLASLVASLPTELCDLPSPITVRPNRRFGFQKAAKFRNMLATVASHPSPQIPWGPWPCASCLNARSAPCRTSARGHQSS